MGRWPPTCRYGGQGRVEPPTFRFLIDRSGRFRSHLDTARELGKRLARAPDVAPRSSFPSFVVGKVWR